MNTKHLKAKILDLAIRGKLVPQDSSEVNAVDLLKEHNYIPEEEIPFEIPENWCWCRLPELCTIPITDGTHQTPTYSDKENGIPFLSSKDVTKQIIDWSNIKYITKELHKELYKRVAPQKDDVLLAKNGTTGVAALVEDDRIFDIYVTLAVLRPNKTFLNPRYLLWTINSPVCKEQFNAHLLGIGVPNLHLYEINKTLVPLPPLSEQQRIASVIEKAFEQIDIIEKNKLNLKTYIKQTKSKVLDLAIHGKLVEQNPGEGNAFELLEKIRKEKSDLIKQKKIKEDKKSSFIIKAEDGKHYEQFADGTLKDIEDEIPFEIPENWCWCRLREIGNWQSGCTPDKSRKDFYDKADIPWLNSGDLTDSYIETIPHYVSQIAFDEKKMKLNEAGSVCIAMYGATIGKLGILTKSATTNQAVLVCNKLHLSDSKYLFYFLKSHKKEYIQAGFGGAQPNISKEKVEPTLFPLPPLAEQKRIVKKIEQIFEQLDILDKSLGD